MDRRGVAALEFAMVAPLLFLLFFGIIEAGTLFYQYMTLTNAVSTSAAQFAFSAGVDATPYTDAVGTVKPGCTEPRRAQRYHIRQRNCVQQ